jgi:hypothetical protein
LDNAKTELKIDNTDDAMRIGSGISRLRRRYTALAVVLAIGCCLSFDYRGTLDMLSRLCDL